MDAQLATLLRPLLGLVLGGTIGLAFALMQAASQRRQNQRRDEGSLKTGWSLVPGSMTRIVFLLAALVLVQAVSPALFSGSGAWWVSAGVAAGYGSLLGWRLYRRQFAPVATASRPS